MRSVLALSGLPRGGWTTSAFATGELDGCFDGGFWTRSDSISPVVKGLVIGRR